MCGRYAITTAPEAIRRLFGVAGPTPNFAARYNAAPGLDRSDRTLWPGEMLDQR